MMEKIILFLGIFICHALLTSAQFGGNFDARRAARMSHSAGPMHQNEPENQREAERDNQLLQDLDRALASGRKSLITDVIRLIGSLPERMGVMVSDPTTTTMRPPPQPQMMILPGGYARKSLVPGYVAAPSYAYRPYYPYGYSVPQYYGRKGGLLQNIAQNSLANMRDGINRVADILDYKPYVPRPQSTYVISQPYYY